MSAARVRRGRAPRPFPANRKEETHVEQTRYPDLRRWGKPWDLLVSRALQAAALVGGGLAAASLATSALLGAGLIGRRGEQDASAVALHRLTFAAGGPVHGAGFGVLVGSLGLAGLRTGELPRPVALAGLASAAVGSLSPLYFVWKPAAWFIPAGRFSGLLVSGIAGVRLGRRSG